MLHLKEGSTELETLERWTARWNYMVYGFESDWTWCTQWIMASTWRMPSSKFYVTMPRWDLQMRVKRWRIPFQRRNSSARSNCFRTTAPLGGWVWAQEKKGQKREGPEISGRDETDKSQRASSSSAVPATPGALPDDVMLAQIWKVTTLDHERWEGYPCAHWSKVPRISSCTWWPSTWRFWWCAKVFSK